MNSQELKELYNEYTKLKSKLDEISKKIDKIHRKCTHGDSVCIIVRDSGFYNCTTCEKKIPISEKGLN